MQKNGKFCVNKNKRPWSSIGQAIVVVLHFKPLCECLHLLTELHGSDGALNFDQQMSLLSNNTTYGFPSSGITVMTLGRRLLVKIVKPLFNAAKHC